MTPGYSILILNEVILPTEKCPWQHAALDIIMMSSFAGLHRSHRRLHELLTSVGLEDIKFWYPPEIGDGIVQAVVRQNGSDARIGNRTYHSTNAQYNLPNEQDFSTYST